MFEAVRGAETLGYVALDDIAVSIDENCAIKPADATPTTPR